MKFLLPLLLGVCCIQSVVAQKETNNWIIGPSAGVTFVNGNPQLTGVINTDVYNASYSDANGNLQFVFAGGRVLDRNFSIMAGSAIGSGSYHITLIAASPSNINQYYIFYISTFGTNPATQQHTLMYAIVDMSLNGGLGRVITNGTFLEDRISLAYTLVQKKGTRDFWIVTHKQHSDVFHSRLVTAAGITPFVTSQAGTYADKTAYNYVDLKPSPNGELLAGISYKYHPLQPDERFLEVFNIDAQTGIVTTKVKGTTRTSDYQSPSYLEFSPDNRLLYVAYSYYVTGLQPCGWGASNLLQYNLCYTDSASFNRYAPMVYNTFSFCGMLYVGKTRLGPNKKIYMRYGSTDIPAVDRPNIIGTHCDMNPNAFTIPLTSYGDNLPDFYHAYLQKAVINNIAYTGGCYPNPWHFKITNDTINHIEWNFGDAASGGNNTSLNKEEDHIFSAPGYYTVTAGLYASDGRLIEKVETLVEIKDPNKRLLYDYPKDTAHCQSQTLTLKLDVVNGVFTWYKKAADGTYTFNTLSDSFTITSSGKYMVEMRQNGCNGCIMQDSIEVTILASPQFSLGADANVCTGDSLRLTAYAPGADLLWNTGATTEVIYTKTGGQFWVRAEYNNNGCPFSDTINITQQQGLTFTLPNDTTLCSNQTLLLNPGIINASYIRWQDGSANTSFNVTTPGRYWVYAYANNGCSRSDTIYVSYINGPAVYLGADTTLCVGDSVKLSANVANAAYEWSTGITDPTLMVKNSGQYWIKATAVNGCTNADTINVYNKPLPGFTLGNDTTLCDRQQLTYNFNLPAATYTWSTGNTQPQVFINQPGNYWLEVSQQGCIKRDSVAVSYNPSPAVNLGNDTTLCEGVSYTLSTGAISNATYTWQNNSTGPSFVVNATGKYWVRVLLNGCANTDTVNVSYILKPVFELGNDTLVCKGQTFTLQPNVDGEATFLWQNGSTAPSFNVTEPGTYGVTISNGCGTASDKINIKHGLCLLIMPNAFSPNRDGLNDVFKIKYPWFIKDFHMAIFNRWGQKIFESRDPYTGWNGTCNGIDQPAGGYVWVISLTDKEGQKDSSRGFILLTR